MSQAQQTIRLRNYNTTFSDVDLLHSVKIWEAARATSAATSFFEPMLLGEIGEMFVDGGLGANNPIAEMWDEARNVWPGEPLESRVGLILSVGTGLSSVEPYNESLKGIIVTLKQIAVQTETTERTFRRDHRDLAESGRYCRLNATSGVGNIGLGEEDKIDTIIAMTRRYYASQEVQHAIQVCLEHGKEEVKQQKKQGKPRFCFEARPVANLHEAQPLVKPFFEGKKMITVYYVDRDSLFFALKKHRASIDHGGPRIILVHGLPGSGKTQLSRSYANHCLEAGDAIFWLDASSKDTLRTSFVSIARSLQIRSDSALSALSVDDVSNLVMQHCQLSSLQNLFVYDNYDSVEEPLGYHLLPYLPAPEIQCQIVITSRNGSPVAVLGTGTRADTLPMEVMTDKEATDLLSNLLQHPVQAQGDSLGNHLRTIACNLMGRLPLAIAQAGSYIRNMKRYEPDMQLLAERYIREYQTREDRLLRATDGTFVKEYGKSVVTTFDMAFQAIESDETRSLLLLFGFFHHRGIDIAWFESVFRNRIHLSKSNIDLESPGLSWFSSFLKQASDGTWDSSELKTSLYVLSDYSLIHLHPDRTRWDIHPLISSWAIIFQQLRDQNQLNMNGTLAGAIMVEAYDPDEDPKKIQYDNFQLSLHEHVGTWFRRCETSTDLLTIPTPRVSSYTLTRLISCFDSLNLRAKEKRTNYIEKLTSIALWAGLKPDQPVDRYPLNQIGNLLMHVSNSFDMPASALIDTFAEIRSAYAASRSSANLYDDTVMSELRLSLCLREAKGPAGMKAALEQVLDTTTQFRPQMRSHTYFTARGVALWVMCRSRTEPEERESLFIQYKALVEDAVLNFGEQHKLCVDLRSKLYVLDAAQSTQHGPHEENMKRLAEENPTLYASALMKILEAEVQEKWDESGFAAPGMLELLRRRRDLKRVEYGDLHQQVLEDENLIFSQMEVARGYVPQDRIPNAQVIKWLTMRKELTTPSVFLILTKIWHPDASFDTIWSELLALACEDDISKRVLLQCIEALNAAPNKLQVTHADLARHLRACVSPLKEQFLDQQSIRQEPISTTLRWLRLLWNLLGRIESSWSENDYALEEEKLLVHELEGKKSSIFETGIFFVQNYILVLLLRYPRCTRSPLTLGTVEKLEMLLQARLSGRHALCVQFSTLSSICYRVLEEDARARKVEDSLIALVSTGTSSATWQTEPKEAQKFSESLSKAVLTGSKQAEANNATLFSVDQTAAGCLEKVCQTYILSGYDGAAARIYESWSRSLAAKDGFASPSVLPKIILCGWRCEGAKKLQPFQNLVDDLIQALGAADRAVRVSLSKDVMVYWLPVFVSKKCWRTAIILAEGLKRFFDSTAATAETTTPFVIVTESHWCLLKMLRIAYAALGYSKTALELIGRQEVLEQTLIQPQHNPLYQKMVNDDREERRRLLD